MSNKKSKLAIISHTEHYHTADGTVVGWGPTISEVNHLAEDFEEVYHIAFLHKGNPPSSALPYTSSNIKFVPLSPIGGKDFLEKLRIVLHIPRKIKTINRYLKKVDVYQLRTPTGMGVFLIPYLSLFSRKKGWYKYAGNWNQENPPLGYALQRFMLKRQNRKVTINGHWPNQPKHCLTFENPCLTQSERINGLEILKSKSYNSKFNFCFVGRLEDAKGVQRIIDAFGMITSREKVAAIHFVGDGEKVESYKTQCQELNLPVVFHGFLEREKVFDLYIKCQFLILPSDSEGFPKVVAEAMNYGCIPIVSDVSSIGQYINSTNGFLIKPINAERLLQILKEIVVKEEVELQNIARNAYDEVVSFTFEHYRNRVQSELIN